MMNNQTVTSPQRKQTTNLHFSPIKFDQSNRNVPSITLTILADSLALRVAHRYVPFRAEPLAPMVGAKWTVLSLVALCLYHSATLASGARIGLNNAAMMHTGAAQHARVYLRSNDLALGETLLRPIRLHSLRGCVAKSHAVLGIALHWLLRPIGVSASGEDWGV